ncbi:hypothetical protein [Colwellia sp. MEBiC06753]
MEQSPFKPEFVFPVSEVLIALGFILSIGLLSLSLRKKSLATALKRFNPISEVTAYKSVNLDRTTRLITLKIEQQTVYFIETKSGIAQVNTDFVQKVVNK